jgi:hypothetical protein
MINDIVAELELKFNTKFKKIGSRYLALCPFHNERTPSFYFFPETMTCYCFGCGKFVNLVKEKPKPYRDKEFANLIKRKIKKIQKEINNYLIINNTKSQFFVGAIMFEIDLLKKILRALTLDYIPVNALKILFNAHFMYRPNVQDNFYLFCHMMVDSHHIFQLIIESSREKYYEENFEKLIPSIEEKIKAVTSQLVNNIQ